MNSKKQKRYNVKFDRMEEIKRMSGVVLLSYFASWGLSHSSFSFSVKRSLFFLQTILIFVFHRLAQLRLLG